ncbi:hypothetical protein E2C01_055819 [Portunus trituberculatus]|uniref:Uncharacterized protein n=1 Tax=Portunus trituberculatus TaxID=210409 RepID=A0A5B7GYQ3_PORTR|nr:hypothetical protein [Portunus trituberculatus]
MVKEQPGVNGVTSRDGSIQTWLTDKDRPVQITNPGDLHKVGIVSPDWKRLRLDHLSDFVIEVTLVLWEMSAMYCYTAKMKKLPR